MLSFLNSIIDLIYRKKCYFCGKSKFSQKMCPECYDEMNFSDIKVSRVINGVNIYSCGVYEKYLQKLIRGIKYHNQKELAFFLAKFMSEYFKQLNSVQKYQVIPVPLHKNRIKQRKYNHMELVGEEFCKLTENILNTDLVKRIKDTKPQYKLSRKERLENLSSAFEVDKTKLLQMPVMIIDDICATGSTFEEMIKTMQQAGISEIICIAASSPAI